jgi:ubiquinone/menaquinone biosynthesis C-methylase UbiE/uncharacterized protein YbaR (Trm112 family)
MRPGLLDRLRCRACGAAPLRLEAGERDEREVRTGTLTCPACSARFPIRAGIPDLLDPDDAALQREVAGWETLAGELGEGLVPTMTALPWYPHDPWPFVAPDFFQLFELISFEGARILDVGAGRCWSSRFLAALGRGSSVTAVDVLTKRFLGLETADVFLAEDGCYFERIRCDAHRLPIADAVFDVAVACAAVHHSGDLPRLFGEVHRVLRPGGTFAFVSEPSKALRIRERRPDNEETRLGINEHIYFLREYEEALRATGFRWRRVVPRSIALRLAQGDPTLLEGFTPWMRGRLATERGRRGFLRLLRAPGLDRWLYRWASLPVSILARRPR